MVPSSDRDLQKGPAQVKVEDVPQSSSTQQNEPPADANTTHNCVYDHEAIAKKVLPKVFLDKLATFPSGHFVAPSETAGGIAWFRGTKEDKKKLVADEQEKAKRQWGDVEMGYRSLSHYLADGSMEGYVQVGRVMGAGEEVPKDEKS